MKIKPLNRHLVVHKKPQKKKETNSAFILPEGYESSIEKYSVVEVLDVAEDSKLKGVKPGSEVVVETSMLFEVAESVLVLENYVYGLVDEKTPV
jgi:co-chaperonin GroES (HSP10)